MQDVKVTANCNQIGLIIIIKCDSGGENVLTLCGRTLSAILRLFALKSHREDDNHEMIPKRTICLHNNHVFSLKYRGSIGYKQGRTVLCTMLPHRLEFALLTNLQGTDRVLT